MTSREEESEQIVATLNDLESGRDRQIRSIRSPYNVLRSHKETVFLSIRDSTSIMCFAMIIYDNHVNIFMNWKEIFERVSRMTEIEDKWESRLQDAILHVYLFSLNAEYSYSLRINVFFIKVAWKNAFKLG